MFGGGQQTNSPFGSTGGGFGQPNTAPAFGSAAPATGGIFGNPAPAPFGAAPAPAFGSTGFGAPATSTPFGSSAPAPSGGLFGQPAPAPAFGGGFSAPAPAPSTGMFGAPAPASAFGAPAPTGSFFGQTSSTTNTGGLFGSSTGGFGTQTSSTFGGAPAPAFGAPAGGGLFGSAPAPTGGGIFGSTPAPAPFGSPAPAPFGGSTFGSPAPAAFGAPAPGGLFGSPAPAPGMFGAPAPGVPGAGGTRGTPFSVTPKSDGSTSINFQSISAMAPYESKSFEELRFEDYSLGNRGSANTTPTASNTSSFFGGPTSAPAGGSIFGGNPAPAPGGLFGSTPAPAPFGAPAPAGGGIFGGSAPAPAFGGFGAPAPAPGGFGAPAPAAFGAPAPSSGGLFGGSAPAPAFGGFGTPAPAPGGFGAPAPAPGGFGAPAPSSGGLFGSTSPAPAFGGFGTPAPAPFGAPAPGGFGAPAPSSGGLFSSSSPAPAFGGFGTPAPAPGGFGVPAPAPFGAAPAPGSLFGAPNPAPAPWGQQPAPAAFGANPPAMQQQGVFPMGGSAIPPNAQIIPAATEEMFKFRMSNLENMKNELEKNRAWEPDNSYHTTPTASLASPNANFGAPPPPYAISSASMLANTSSPPSARKIRPRGFFPRQNGVVDTTPTAKISELGRGGSMADRSHSRSSVMQLVVKPNSVGKLRFRHTALESETSPTAPGPADSPGFDSRSEGGSSLTPLAVNNAATPKAQAAASPQAPPQTPTNSQPSEAAEALYRESISDDPQTPTPLKTPDARRSPASHLAPKLTKEGYETVPPIDELAQMSEADLATVQNFTVRRRGTGEVVWEGAVDVRGVDLDRVVSIEPKDVSVYSIEEEEGTKPAVGTKLNRPAAITYEEVFPRDDPQASKTEMDKFALRLEKRCEKMGAEFVSYERSTGTWTIRVVHFSRYALVDEDDSDDDTPMERVANKRGNVTFSGFSTPKQPKTILRRKQTPYNRMTSEDIVMEEAEILETVKREAAHAYESVFSILAEEKPVMTEDDTMAKSQSTTEIIEQDIAEDEGTTLTVVPPDDSALGEAKRLSSICSQLLRKATKATRSSISIALRSEKVLRVGLHPQNGRLYHPSIDEKSRIEIKRPVFGTNIALSQDLLGLLLSACSIDMRKGDCPQLLMPQNDGKSRSALLDFLERAGSLPFDIEEIQQSFTLLAALLETPEISSSIIVSDDKRHEMYTFDERRNQALLQWLIQVNAGYIAQETEDAIRRKDIPSAIFAAVTGGDLVMATKIAANVGHLDLALAFCTGGEGRVFLFSMIARMIESGKSSEVPQNLLRSLRAVSGEVVFEESLCNLGKKLKWTQRLALKLIQKPDIDLQSLLLSYDNDVKNGYAPFPSPVYHGGSSSATTESVLYRILRVIADPRSSGLLDVVHTNGFSQNTHDLSSSFFIAMAIVASGYVAADEYALEQLSSGFEAQLLDCGLWEYGIAVSLCSPTTPSAMTSWAKMQRAYNYVLKFFNSDTESGKVSFLKNSVGIPSHWFADACAYKSGDVVEFARNMESSTPSEAMEALERHWLPMVWFLNKTEKDKLLSQIDVFFDDTSDSLAADISRLLKLETSVQGLAGGSFHPGVVASLLKESELLKSKISEALLVQRKGSEFVPYLRSSHVELKHMLREALRLVKKLHFQLVSLTHSQDQSV